MNAHEARELMPKGDLQKTLISIMSMVMLEAQKGADHVVIPDYIWDGKTPALDHGLGALVCEFHEKKGYGVSISNDKALPSMKRMVISWAVEETAK